MLELDEMKNYSKRNFLKTISSFGVFLVGANLPIWASNNLAYAASSFTSYNVFSTLSGSRITAGDTELMDNLNVYPNPTRGLFNIRFIAEKIDNFEITIVDAFGKLVSQEEKQDFIGEYAKQVNLSDYPRGIYMVQIRTNDSFISKRIVLQ